MGARGRLSKPTSIKVLEGNPGKRPLNLDDGIKPKLSIPSPPKHLGIEARKEWKRITPELEQLGLISNLDRAALALYCQAAGRLYELETAFQGQVHRLMAERKLDYSDAVYEASHAVTPSGYAQQSVIVQLIKSHREQLNRYLAHFGLSPAVRSRVQATNYIQPTLPGMEQTSQPSTGFARFAVVQGGAS